MIPILSVKMVQGANNPVTVMVKAHSSDLSKRSLYFHLRQHRPAYTHTKVLLRCGRAALPNHSLELFLILLSTTHRSQCVHRSLSPFYPRPAKCLRNHFCSMICCWSNHCRTFFSRKVCASLPLLPDNICNMCWQPSTCPQVFVVSTLNQ